MKESREAIDYEVEEAIAGLVENLGQIEFYLAGIREGKLFYIHNMKVFFKGFMKTSLLKMYLPEDILEYLLSSDSSFIPRWPEVYEKAIKLEAECFIFFEEYRFNTEFSEPSARNKKLVEVADLVMDKMNDTLDLAEHNLTLINSGNMFPGEIQSVLVQYQLLLPSMPLLMIDTEPVERDIIGLAYKDDMLNEKRYSALVRRSSELQERIQQKIFEYCRIGDIRDMVNSKGSKVLN